MWRWSSFHGITMGLLCLNRKQNLFPWFLTGETLIRITSAFTAHTFDTCAFPGSISWYAKLFLNLFLKSWHLFLTLKNDLKTVFDLPILCSHLSNYKKKNLTTWNMNFSFGGKIFVNHLFLVKIKWMLKIIFHWKCVLMKQLYQVTV